MKRQPSNLGRKRARGSARRTTTRKLAFEALGARALLAADVWGIVAGAELPGFDPPELALSAAAEAAYEEPAGVVGGSDSAAADAGLADPLPMDFGPAADRLPDAATVSVLRTLKEFEDLRFGPEKGLQGEGEQPPAASTDLSRAKAAMTGRNDPDPPPPPWAGGNSRDPNSIAAGLGKTPGGPQSGEQPSDNSKLSRLGWASDSITYHDSGIQHNGDGTRTVWSITHYDSGSTDYRELTLDGDNSRVSFRQTITTKDTMTRVEVRWNKDGQVIYEDHETRQPDQQQDPPESDGDGDPDSQPDERDGTGYFTPFTNDPWVTYLMWLTGETDDRMPDPQGCGVGGEDTGTETGSGAPRIGPEAVTNPGSGDFVVVGGGGGGHSGDVTKPDCPIGPPRTG